MKRLFLHLALPVLALICLGLLLAPIFMMQYRIAQEALR